MFSAELMMMLWRSHFKVRDRLRALVGEAASHVEAESEGSAFDVPGFLRKA